MRTATKTLVVLLVMYTGLVLAIYFSIYVPSIVAIFFFVSPVVVYAVSYAGRKIYDKYLAYVSRPDYILRRGRPVGSKSIRTMTYIVEAISISAFIIYYVALANGVEQSTAIKYAVVPIIILASVLAVMIIYPSSYADKRASGERNELIFFLLFLRVILESHLTVEEGLRSVAKLRSLEWWRREIQFAVNLSGIFRTSLFTVLLKIADFHKDRKIADIIRRIVIMAEYTGDIRNILSRMVEGEIENFFAKLTRNYETVLVVVYTGLVFLSILPIASISTIPVAGIVGSSMMNPETNILLMLLAFGLFYALVNSLVPVMLVFEPSRRDTIIGAVSLVATLVVVIYGYVSQIEVWRMALLVVIVNAPGGVVSIFSTRKMGLYSKVIERVTDAVESTYYTGGNLASRIEELGRQTHGRVGKLLRYTGRGIIAPFVLNKVISGAPTRFHKIFFETLQYVTLHGARLDAFYTLAKIYERIRDKMSSIISAGTTAEGYAILIVGINGFMAGFLKATIIRLLEELARSTGGGFAMYGLSLSLNVSGLYPALLSTYIPTILLALITTKIKYGTWVFYTRLVTVASLVYIIAYILPPSFISI